MKWFFFTFWPPVEAYLNLMFIPNFSWLANWHLLWKDPILSFVFTKKKLFFNFFLPFFRCFLGFFGTLWWCFWWVRNPKSWFQGSVLRLSWLQIRIHYPIVKFMAGPIACRLKLIQRKYTQQSAKKGKNLQKKGKMYCK